MATVKINGFRCDKCGHEWAGRKGKVPEVCPSCHTRRWNETETRPAQVQSATEHEAMPG